MSSGKVCAEQPCFDDVWCVRVSMSLATFGYVSPTCWGVWLFHRYPWHKIPVVSDEENWPMRSTRSSWSPNCSLCLEAEVRNSQLSLRVSSESSVWAPVEFTRRAADDVWFLWWGLQFEATDVMNHRDSWAITRFARVIILNRSYIGSG